MSLTPAMTLFDVAAACRPGSAEDGAAAAARAILLAGLTGSIGIDLPTCRATACRRPRRAVDAILPPPLRAQRGQRFIGFLRSSAGDAALPSRAASRRSGGRRRARPAAQGRKARRPVDLHAAPSVVRGDRGEAGLAGGAGAATGARLPCLPGRSSHIAGHSSAAKTETCALCGKPARAAHRPFCSQLPRPRPLNWLGKRLPRPRPARRDPTSRARFGAEQNGLDSER